MAEAGSWTSIRGFGLLSTTALLDVFDIAGEERISIESRRRCESAVISKYGRAAIIRDQKPLSESALERCLEGMTPAAWYQLLNSKVFFWLTESRLNRLLRARGNRDRIQTVIIVDTRELLTRHASRTSLSALNSGSTLHRPMPRGLKTFTSIEEYPFEVRRTIRGRAEAIAELAVDYSVPDISELAIEVTERQNGVVLRTLYRKEGSLSPASLS
jgi:hypothetical protein